MRNATFTKLAVVSLMCGAVLTTEVAIQGQTAAQKTTAKEKAAAKAALDLNKATSDELQELPGVGEVTAKKIIDGRPYSSVDDLAKAGVPARVINSIRSKVRVGEAVAAKSKSGRATEANAKSEKVNLNTADAGALEALPGIGPAHAKAIIAARPFKSVDDLAKVRGVGKSRFDVLKDLVTIEAPAAKGAASKTTRKTAGTTTKEMPKLKPGEKININTASKEELEDLLPGIGPVKAQAIIDARPFKTIEDVMKVKGIKEGEFGKIKDLISVN
jgi:competence ComEA-like helix-hairpin-helix protein